MRCEKLAILLALSVAVAATFVFAPLVRVFGTAMHCSVPYNSNLSFNGCENVPVSAYESPSCAVFGLGVAHDDWAGGSGQPSYYVGCPTLPRMVSSP
jgi:hypothetical protein